MEISSFGAIDCDIHPAPGDGTPLLPFLDEHWRDIVVDRGLLSLEVTSYPPRAPISARADWRPAAGSAGSDLGRMQSEALDGFGLSHAICNPLWGAASVYDPYLGAALCRAVNDWVAADWLDRDPRLRASILIHPADPAAAADEIERLAGDLRFVQVLLLAQGEMPLGRRHFWPIYEAAQRHRLAIGIHAGSAFRHPPSQSGFFSTLSEDYVAQTQGFCAQIASLIAEGVFAKFPDLRVVLIESGVTWLPAFMWRFSKDWRGVRHEVPWVDRSPAAIIRDHVRLTVQPFDGPADAADVARLIGQLGSDEMLLFSTDYPHWQFDGDDALPPGISGDLLKKILVDNALATYPRLREARP